MENMQNANVNVNTNVYEDFGEKIGGARKDLWKERGLYVSDLEAMNGREAEKFVKKDNIWKKPDYQSMHDSGIPLGVVYFVKKVRDSVNASPKYYYKDNTSERRLARQKEYIETVRQLQAVMEDVHTVDDAMEACDRFMVNNGYLTKGYGYGGRSSYSATEKGRENPTVTQKLLNTLIVSSVRSFERDFTVKAKTDQFLVPKEKKVPAGYAIRCYDGKNAWPKRDDLKPGTWYVSKGYLIIQGNFPAQETALKWVQDYAKQKKKNNGKTRFTPPQLADVKRDGPDFREGRDITGQDYLDTFGFRGGEFGNWMNQNDRKASLNMGYEALKDLAAVLNVDDKDIAFQGTLAIAFGARGSGNASAHYEPLRKVINLTKMHGAGSLAHEWWHALDDYLGTRMGADGMLSERTRLYVPFKKLVDTMKYKPETPEQTESRIKVQTERMRKNASDSMDYAVLEPIKRHGNEEQLKTYMELREKFLSGEKGSVEQISALKKSVTERVIPKEERERLEMFEHILHSMSEEEIKPGRVETDYYRNSVRMGKECEKDGGYWESNTEMTARAFACYVKDRLSYRSDYLVGHADCAVTFVAGKDGKLEVLKAFPEGEERKAINAAFDKVMETLRQEGILGCVDVETDGLQEMTEAV